MSIESSGRIGDSEVTLFGGVKGLMSEGEKLQTAFSEAKPEVILISISEEHVEGLSKFMKDPYEMMLSDYEIIYGVHLSVYGDVMTPPPIYTESIKYAEENGIEILGLDMNEEDFQKLYSGKVGTFDLIRHSVRKKRLLKAEFKDRTPEEFVKAWESRVNRIKALRQIDEERVSIMKKALGNYLSPPRWGKIMIVVDYEFYEEFRKFLQSIEKSE